MDCNGRVCRHPLHEAPSTTRFVTLALTVGYIIPMPATAHIQVTLVVCIAVNHDSTCQETSTLFPSTPL